MEMRASFTLKHGEEIIAPCDCYLSNWSVGSVRCLPENVNLVLEGENVPFEVNKEISRGHRISCFVDIDKNRIE